MSKRTGRSLICTINTAPTFLMVTVGLAPEQAARVIRVRRVLPLVEDRKAPCIDARKLWERVGKPHGRFRDWADAYLKPLLARTDLSAEISALKVPARGTPRTDYIVSRDLAAHLAMMANTNAGADVRAYFLDMEDLALRLANHFPIRATAIVDTDNRVASMFTRKAANDAKDTAARGTIRAAVTDKERRLKELVCDVLSGHSTAHWRQTFGRGIRDVLDSGDILTYSKCYESAHAMIEAGIRSEAGLRKALAPTYGRRVDIGKYRRLRVA